MELAKETCAIMSIQVIYEIDNVSTQRFNNINCTKLIFFMYLLIGNQYYFFGLPKIRVGWAHTTKN